MFGGMVTQVAESGKKLPVSIIDRPGRHANIARVATAVDGKALESGTRATGVNLDDLKATAPGNLGPDVQSTVSLGVSADNLNAGVSGVQVVAKEGSGEFRHKIIAERSGPLYPEHDVLRVIESTGPDPVHDATQDERKGNPRHPSLRVQQWPGS
jgi:hypothetical protein